MTIQSLQKIVSLENSLYAAEQYEREKASSWLKEQQEDILRRYEKDIAALEEKKTAATVRSAGEAKKSAAEIIQSAKTRADFLDRIEDTVLRHHLEKTLKFIVGQAP